MLFFSIQSICPIQLVELTSASAAATMTFHLNEQICFVPSDASDKVRSGDSEPRKRKRTKRVGERETREEKECGAAARLRRRENDIRANDFELDK